MNNAGNDVKSSSTTNQTKSSSSSSKGRRLPQSGTDNGNKGGGGGAAAAAAPATATDTAEAEQDGGGGVDVAESSAPAAVASSSPSPNNGSNTHASRKKPPPDYNQKWFGYVLIMFTSLLNWTAVSSVTNDQRVRQSWRMAICFGVMTFLISALVLIQDRTQKCLGFVHYTKARNGYIEGYVLLTMCIWWIVGVAYLTSPGGIAYIASNIYYSAWFTLFSCIHTLDEWSTEKDILSLQEITGVSYTLKGWWIHLLSACVVFGSCIDMYMTLGEDDFDDTSFGIALGLVSIVLSFFYILMHYDFFSSCGLEEGGWLELSSAIFLIVCWCIGLSILTQDGGIAATMEGNQCTRDERFRTQNENCTVVLYQQEEDGTIARYEVECGDSPRQIPGSNVFFASWTCMLSVVYVAFRWKAAQAIKFAQAKEERAQRRINGVDGSDDDNVGADYDENDEEEEDDNDDDL